MKIVAISDTHTQHKLLTIPECDVLVHAGDSTFTGDFFEVRDFVWWLKDQPARHKVVIAGNHEETFDSTHEKYDAARRDMLAKVNDDSIIYLENSAVEIDGIKFYGTPWTPWFYSWGFNGIEGADAPFRIGANGNRMLEEVYGEIPNDTNVLICHGPPYGILDYAYDGRQGSVTMRKVLESQRLLDLKLYLCGHIHESRGHEVGCGGVNFCNVSSLGRDYKTAFPPVVIELDEDGFVESVQGYAQ